MSFPAVLDFSAWHIIFDFQDNPPEGPETGAINPLAEKATIPLDAAVRVNQTSA
jgi:hypothetical protein